MRENNPLESAIEQIIEQLPEEKRSLAVSLMVERNLNYESPLPPPEIIDYYEQKAPGAAGRLLTMAEKEQAHRHRAELAMIEADTKQALRGSYLGLSVFVLLIIAILASIFLGSVSVAIGLCGIGAVGIIGNFVNSHKK
jgi:uncharacterized membrane protein